jgi:hypothetical protein
MKDPSSGRSYRATFGPRDPRQRCRVQFEGYNSCYRISNRVLTVLFERGHIVLPFSNVNTNAGSLLIV